MEKEIIKYLQDINIQQYKSDIGFKTLMDGVNDNLYVIPKYQRKYKWSKEKLQDLVVSLICEFPIPPIYTYRNSKNQLEILDGQQRIFSLFFYYIGKYVDIKKNGAVDYRKLVVDNRSFQEALEEAYCLEPLQTSIKLDDETEIDITYENLPMEVKRSLNYVTITVIEMRWAHPENKKETMQTIFKNLNSGGIGLNYQEIRNGIYDCKFYDMLHDFNDNNIQWRRLWGEEKEEKDIETLLKLCAYRQYVYFENGTFEFQEYMGRQSSFLDNFSEKVMKLDASPDIIEEYRISLEKFISHMNCGIQKKKSSTLLESLYIVCEKCHMDMDITLEMQKRILNSAQYKTNTTQGTFSKRNMCERWKDVYEILSQYTG
ncbi:MAG: DUF262 domain-containing protein [Lachnospiraceae bacterium]|nr:DUF262 domain-containing protein [Lachnospiraceae bacterium]